MATSRLPSRALDITNQSIQVDSDTESDNDLPSPPLSVRKPSAEAQPSRDSPLAIRSPPPNTSSKRRKISSPTTDKENIVPFPIVPVSSPKSDDDRITDSQIKQSPGVAFRTNAIKFDNSQIVFSPNQARPFDGVPSTPEKDGTWRPAKIARSQSQLEVEVSLSKTRTATSTHQVSQTPDRRPAHRLPSTPFEELEMDYEALIALDAIEAEPMPSELITNASSHVPAQPLPYQAVNHDSPPTSPLKGFTPLKPSDINNPRLAGFFNQFGDDGPSTSLEDQNDMVEAWTQHSQKKAMPRKNSRGRPYHKQRFYRRK